MKTPTNPTERVQIYRQIEQDFENHIEQLMAMLRQPSVSATGEGIEAMAEQLVQRICELDGDVHAEPTTGNPVVYGKLDVGAPRTLLFYLLYDVQPAPAEGWRIPPFQPEVIDLPGHGPSILGRGAFNSKGPLCGFLNVLEAFRRCGQDLPVNIVFMVEGEEEVGSRSLPAFVDAHRDELARCDAVYQPYLGENVRGQTLTYLGCKGMMYLELVCRGGEWGGPVGREIHALHSAWIGNPAWRLVQALATLKQGADERTAVAGWYDRVASPGEAELHLLDTLIEHFDPATILREQGVQRFKFPNDTGPEALLRAYLYEPTLNLDGIYGGYTGPGAKTVIPFEARAKLDVRPVPDQDLDELLDLLRDHFDRHGFSDLDIEVVTKVPWSQSNPDSPAVQALLAALDEHGPGPVMAWPRSAGMVPHHLFTRTLGLPIAFGGAGHGGRAHSTDEYVTVEGLLRHELGSAAFLLNFAEMPEGSP